MEAARAPAPRVAALFKPFTIGKIELSNRIVMAPMTRSFSPGGIPGEDVAAYYRRRAENDVGLIITEGTVVNHPAASKDSNVPQFHGAEALAGWAKVASEVKAVGGRIIPQLWHVGMLRIAGQPPNPDASPVGPSGIFIPDLRRTGTDRSPRQIVPPMTEAEVESLIDAYAQGAADAKRLGFDGVELHAAHGYLIDQFFWGVTNLRTDKYGGSAEKRTRFAVEIVKACRRATGPDFPFVLRFSQWKLQDYTARLAQSPQELAAFLAPLVDAGTDVFHCSTRRFWEPEYAGSPLNLAGWTKKLSGLPVITVGSVSLDSDMFTTFGGGDVGVASIDRIARMVESEEVDLVAVGRALLADPQWASKVRQGRMAEIRPVLAAAMSTLF